MVGVVDSFLEVTLPNPEAFLKVKETLQRIVVASKDKTLIQTAHILHKKSRYYLVHFKELFLLDGKKSTLTENDIARRNSIAMLLEEWELLDIVGDDDLDPTVPVSQLKIIPFKERSQWKLIQKYNLGSKK